MHCIYYKRLPYLYALNFPKFSSIETAAICLLVSLMYSVCFQKIVSRLSGIARQQPTTQNFQKFMQFNAKNLKILNRNLISIEKNPVTLICPIALYIKANKITHITKIENEKINKIIFL